MVSSMSLLKKKKDKEFVNKNLLHLQHGNLGGRSKMMSIEYLQNILKLRKKYEDTIEDKKYKGLTHCWIENLDGTTQESWDLLRPTVFKK
jgi:hypothetical protein